jgi:putative YhdH/YhfP family quinone oxidoreductase
MNTFKALVSRGDGNGKNTLHVEQIPFDFLPENEVLIKVHYSSLNYKDALCAKGHRGISRNYPQIPGIDAAGEIVHDSSGKFAIGESILVTSYDLGMNTPGGFGAYIRVPSIWVHRLPDALSMQDSMALGTAGFTAALALWKMQKMNINPDSGNLLVTGATGGVGLLSVLLASKLGFKVTASTGKIHLSELLTSVGAHEVIHRDEFIHQPEKPLLPARFCGVIDTVGGKTLENVIKQTEKEGAVAICGNVSGNSFSTTVFPQIQRGVSLLGIDSGHIGFEVRDHLWNTLSKDWKISFPDSFKKIIDLKQLPEEIERMLAGGQTGRVIVKHDKAEG